MNTLTPKEKLLDLANFCVDSDMPFHDAQHAFRLTLKAVALEKTGGNKSRAAVLLHIHRNTLERIGKEN